MLISLATLFSVNHFLLGLALCELLFELIQPKGILFAQSFTIQSMDSYWMREQRRKLTTTGNNNNKLQNQLKRNSLVLNSVGLLIALVVRMIIDGFQWWIAWMAMPTSINKNQLNPNKFRFDRSCCLSALDFDHVIAVTQWINESTRTN